MYIVCVYVGVCVCVSVCVHLSNLGNILQNQGKREGKKGGCTNIKGEVVIIDLLLLGCCTRFSCTLIK